VRTVAPDLIQIPLAPRDGINVYIAGDVLVDAGTPRSGRGLVEKCRDRGLVAHALTHAHPDHAGGSQAVCSALGLPCWVSERDAPAVEAGPNGGGRHVGPAAARARLRVPPQSVERRLREGDDVGGFSVMDVPGHSVGHLALWRESDRVLICGDVFFNLQLPSLRPGLREPPKPLTTDPARNRESERRLAALEPAIAVFGPRPAAVRRGGEAAGVRGAPLTGPARPERLGCASGAVGGFGVRTRPVRGGPSANGSSGATSRLQAHLDAAA
jgi:glyoxylase-like metal-dependent hydrolase (beta-lactamase superfamily II)